MIGHGQLGLRSGMRDFVDFTEETSSTKDVFAELRPIKEVPSLSWSLDDGSTYVAPFEFNYDGIRRDVVSVKSSSDNAALVRADSIALCRSTAGTFYYDPEEEFAQEATSWDQASIKWDITEFWDQFPTLYVHLLDGSDPGLQTTVAAIGFYFSGAGSTRNGDPQVHPALGNNLLTDGNFETWAASLPVGWTNSSGLITQDQLNFREGSSSVSMSFNGSDTRILTATLRDLIEGKKYRLGGFYHSSKAVASVRAGGYQINTWAFDDSSYTDRGADLTGNINGKKGIYSAWFKTSSATNMGILTATSSTVRMHITNSGNIIVSGKNTGLSIILSLETNPGFADGEWHHLVAAWDLGNGLGELYVDGVDAKAASTLTNDTIDYTAATWKLGANFAGGNTFDGEMGQVYLNIVEYVDLTNPSVLARFFNASTPVDLKQDGSGPTGSSPILFLHSPFDSILTNSGTGGDFATETGDVTVGLTAPPTISVADDGRHLTDDASFISLLETGKDWNRIVFDFIATNSSMIFELRGVGSEGSVGFDDFQLRRIWRYNWYEPRITTASLPAIETGSSDIFFGGKSIGSGSLSLINHDGYLEKLIAELEWMNQDILVDIGGHFGDGQEILIDNFFRGFTGLVQNLNATDESATFELEDQRIFFHIKLPPRLYDDTIHPSMDIRLQGNPRPLFFGSKENITPARIILESTGFGTYELGDTLLAPNGIKAIDRVWVYLTEEDAKIQRVDRRLQAVSGVDYTEDLANGQFTIVKDVGPYRINERNRRLDFDEGSSELTAVLDSGLYTARTLAIEIQLQMIAVGSSDLTCIVNETTHKFTIAKGGGTLNLLVKTGSNSDSSPYFQLGYDKGSDKTGSLSYIAADPTFEEVDRDHVFRISARGFKDDSLGTFTGSALALIETGSDICRTILINYMGKSSNIIDETSFVFARQRAAETLSLYLNESISTKDIFDRLEFSNIANIIVNGAGKVFYKVYIGEIPIGIIDLGDADFESFSSSKANSEVFTTIRVKYDQNPTSKNFEAREATDSSVAIRLGRPDIKEFDTYIKQGDNARSTADRMLELARFAPRKVVGTVLGAKLLRKEVGDKFRLTRERAISLGGKIDKEIFRLISISKNPLAGVVSFSATDDRVTVASQACVVSCQQFCENSCQATCEQGCQGVCEISCQESCETSCQVNCEQGCQESCQLGCQETCEVTCQLGCQVSCEAGCQGASCQTNCESACQTSCESSCQTSCQGTCQTVCQQGCEVGCEVADQTCVIACQTTCESSCQASCELGCQDTCQTACQSDCQVTCQSTSEDSGEI